MPQLVLLVGPGCCGKTTFMQRYLSATCQREADWVTLSDAAMDGGLHKRNKAVWRAMFPSAPYGFQVSPIAAASPVAAPLSRESLASHSKHVILDGVNASSAERKSLFQHLRNELRKFPTKSGYNNDALPITVTVVLFDDSSRSLKGHRSRGLSARHRLYGCRLADSCFTFICSHQDAEGAATVGDQRALFAAPSSGSVTIDKPTSAEGIDCLLTVHLQDEIGLGSIAEESRRKGLAKLPEPRTSLGICLFKPKNAFEALFYPAAALITFTHSKKAQGVRATFDSAGIKALWEWATGGSDNRRVVILAGELPTGKGAPPTPSQPNSVPITHKMIRQLFTTLALPFPIISFSTRLSQYKAADSSAPTSPSHRMARSKSQISSAGQGASDLLPLDACALAYLERLMNLDIKASVGIVQQVCSAKDVWSLGVRCVGMDAFLADPQSAASAPAPTPRWVDWSANPCFASADRRIRNNVSDAIEHPFGNLISGCIQCHSSDMPQLYGSAQTPMHSRSAQSQAHECPAAAETLAHKSSQGNSLAAAPSSMLATQPASVPSLPTPPNDPVAKQQQRAVPTFACSLIAAELFYGQSAMETGKAYVQASQINMASVKCSFGSPTPYRPLLLTEPSHRLNDSAPDWSPTEPSALISAVASAMVLSSDRSSEYLCTILLCSGKPVASYCACGTASSAYGGNHCRHGAAVAILFAEMPVLSIRKAATEAAEAEQQAAKTSKALDGAAPAEQVIDDNASGAAARSTYVPSSPAVLIGGIPQSMVARQAKVKSKNSATAAQPKSQGAVKILGAHGIPNRKVPLGPGAPKRRILTPYFYFMRSVLASEGDQSAVAGGAQASTTGQTLSFGSGLNDEDTDDAAEEVPKPKKRVTEITKKLAERWRGLATSDKATTEAACAKYNEDVKAEWAAYALTDEYAKYVAAFTAAGGLVATKRARARVQSETDDSGDEALHVSAASAAEDSRPWNQNTQGQWVCVWDTDDSGSDEAPPAPQDGAAAHKPPVLGSLFPNSDSADLGQLTRGSTLAQFGNESTMVGSGMARRRTSRYLSVGSTRDLQ